VDFSKSGKSVEEINSKLLDHGIYGGHDLGAHIDWLEGSALYCFTEMNSMEQIDQLGATLSNILGK